MAKAKNKKDEKVLNVNPKESFETTQLDLSFLHNLSGGAALSAMKKLTFTGILDDGK